MPSHRVTIPTVLVLAFAACTPLFVAAPSSAARSTFSNPAPILLADGARGPALTGPSTITVDGLRGPIAGVTVRLDRLSHANPDDLDILLVAPSGESVFVMSDACGSADLFNETWTFGQGPPILPVAPGPLPDNGPPTPCDSFTYQPTNWGGGDSIFPNFNMVPTGSSFTAFNNEDPNGVWTLRAQDDIDGGGGQIAGGWALTIETRPVAAAVPGAGTEGIAAPYPVTRTVDMGDTVITDLNVEIDGIFHESPDDLDLLLVGPTGETVVLMSDACGTSDVAAYGWAWNDEALSGMPDGGDTDVCNTRTWRPTNHEAGEPWPAPAPIGPHGTNLAAFDLTSPNGEWRLFAQDDSPGGIGYFTSEFVLDMIVRTKANMRFTEDSVVLPEGATRTLTLTRAGFNVLAAAKVTVKTAPASATSGADFTPLSTVVTFAPNQTDATVPIASLPDSADEGEETYTVSISAPRGDARLGFGPSTTTVTIPDLSRPQTTIDRGPASSTAREATLRFSSSEAGSSFRCSLDGQAWKACTSPVRLTRLTVGEHQFRVRAKDPAGNLDRTPAAHSWRVRAS